ncbi:serine hydrolase domain-containing protein [Nakamurella alba]|uniref:serine hydrolase domain-containing protein n=1 Tax=Nakamurella alba TaxID=2665158 RepID=UPI001E4437C7|nr:serine hydrolase domain-containing protein [Nakamurella alba]
MDTGTAPLHGSTDQRFSAVRDSFRARLDSGDDLGAGLHVRIGDEVVVDLWGGHRDPARTVPWSEDTITNVWSTTKTVTNLAMLLLVEQGLLDVDAPVAAYWPEFAAAGKEQVLVRHVMGHTSGVSGWERRPFTTADMYDRAGSVALLAAQAPWWTPGSASGYHGNTQGHLLGEIVRRVSGLPLREFVAERIAGPLGADFGIGARPEDRSRIADIVPPPPLPFDISGMDQDSPPTSR